jgi:hypothetical protein
LASLPIVNAAVREIDIRGVFRYANCYPAALSLIASGRIDVKPLITHRYNITESVQAFEMAESGEAIKVMVGFSLSQSLILFNWSFINILDSMWKRNSTLMNGFWTDFFIRTFDLILFNKLITLFYCLSR